MTLLLTVSEVGDIVPVMTDHLSPLTVAELLLGGVETVARIGGRDEKAAYHWRNANSMRDAGDIPSTRIMRSLLAHAGAHDIPLKPEYLIWGAPAAEIEALLDQMADRRPEDAA